jgi:hypothetical protein
MTVNNDEISNDEKSFSVSSLVIDSPFVTRLSRRGAAKEERRHFPL